MLPFVSLIMPTRGRPTLSAIALECALNQSESYTPDQMEIIIFDDGDFPSFNDPPTGQIKRDQQLVRYFRHPRTLFPSLGDKRNAMCEEARGEIIAHVDSDDLSAPNRVYEQVKSLFIGMTDISGFHTLPFYDISTGTAYLYHLNKACVCGTSLMYRREFWLTHPFPTADIGEDLPYTGGNPKHRISSDGRGLLVALLHADNMSSSKQVRNHPTIFPQIPVDSLPAWFKTRYCGNVSEISDTSDDLFTQFQDDGNRRLGI
jgi:glycosyltransferase involved in cell wall biosynthesis